MPPLRTKRDPNKDERRSVHPLQQKQQAVTTPTDPMALFDALLERASTMLQTAFIESERPWPADAGTLSFIKTCLGVGIASTTEFLATHPEMLALAGQPICTACRAMIETLQVGVDPARTSSETEIVKVAWPCGHVQAS